MMTGTALGGLFEQSSHKLIGKMPKEIDERCTDQEKAHPIYEAIDRHLFQRLKEPPKVSEMFVQSTADREGVAQAQSEGAPEDCQTNGCRISGCFCDQGESRHLTFVHLRSN